MNRVALVTGGSGGFGSRLSVEFARAGFSVGVHYLSGRDRAESVVRRIKDLGGEALSARADITSLSEVKGMVEAVISRWGRIDALVNNAGITHQSPVAAMREEDWERVVATNLRGAFLCARMAAPVMAGQGSGHIINISSILGACGGRGEAAYAASKAALLGFTKSLAKELGSRNIAVNAVMPGFMLTAMTESLNEKALESAREANAFKGFTETEESARFIVRLSEARCVTGQLFNLDGRIYRWI